jgi:hypothetical protein
MSRSDAVIAVALVLAEAREEIDRLRRAIVDWRYSHDEIEAACGGEVALDVRARVMARRAAIIADRPNAQAEP